MLNEDLALEISMRSGIPLDDVEGVLEEEDLIYEELDKKRRKKKMLVFLIFGFVFVLGAFAACVILDKKQKLDMEELIKKYTQRLTKKFDL